MSCHLHSKPSPPGARNLRCGPARAGSVRFVPDRPYTLLSCAVSIDGYLDDASPDRLILSGPEDLDEVDALRAAADAILVGAGTIRADNPRLLVRDPARIAAREAAGKPPHPLRVTLTATGDLHPAPQPLNKNGPAPPPLMEGGPRLLRDALAGNLADELRLAIAPFFVADPSAPRFALPAPYPHTAANPMTLLSLRRVGEVAVHHYRLTGEADRTAPFE